ncbi:MAG TPA: hypothetical protein VK196_18185 [Magnetospirillum sp.]|nr:hypothetical protein [Magnetospirillum sp.]
MTDWFAVDTTELDAQLRAFHRDITRLDAEMNGLLADTEQGRIVEAMLTDIQHQIFQEIRNNENDETSPTDY